MECVIKTFVQFSGISDLFPIIYWQIFLSVHSCMHAVCVGLFLLNLVWKREREDTQHTNYKIQTCSAYVERNKCDAEWSVSVFFLNIFQKIPLQNRFFLNICIYTPHPHSMQKERKWKIQQQKKTIQRSEESHHQNELVAHNHEDAMNSLPCSIHQMKKKYFEIYNVWIYITDFCMWRELIKNSVEQLQLHRLIARTEKKGAKDHDAPLIFWSLFITSWLTIGNEWASIERRNQLIWKCDWFII